MSLTNFKVEWKLKWTKYCVLSPVGNDNDNANNIIFTIRVTKFYVPAVAYQQEAIKNYQNFLAKDSNGQFIGMNKKQKVRK